MNDVVCFTCGLPVGDPYRLNTFEDGEACPTCSVRALESIPPALPRWQATEPSREPDPVTEDADGPPAAS